MENREKILREFILLNGEAYSSYGLPKYCGWLEALLTLTDHPLSQQEISQKLTQLLGSRRLPTSLTTIHRGLKYLEEFGVVKKSGSHKLGYTYTLRQDADLLVAMMSKFSEINGSHVARVKVIREKATEDSTRTILGKHIATYEEWDRILKKWLNRETR